MSNDIAIKIEKLSKRYVLGNAKTGNLRSSLQYYWERLSNREQDKKEEFWALKEVSFEIKRGEVFGIIGRNGAGKSTLLKILSRITPPTAGRVELNGRVASLLEVGTGFHPELTGRENIFMNGSLLGMTGQEIRSKLGEIVAFSGVERFLDTPVKRYSSGMYVRLAFSIAAHLDPEILLIDEVLAVGDSAFQKKCLGKMDDFAQSGRTVVFVSHNMNIIKNLCKKSILLDQGQILLKSDTVSVIKQYLASGIQSAASFQFKNTIDQIYIKSIDFLNKNLLNTNIFQFGEPFQIKITVQSHIRLTNFHVVVGINDHLNNRIFTTRSADLGITFSIKKNSQRVITLLFEKSFLAPGQYFCQFYLRSGYKNTLSYPKNELSFKITDTASLPNFQAHGLWGNLQFDESVLKWN
ncbi:MAG: ABC transporter ATP-binding protein [Saprospiraceae bacterium]